MKISFGRFDGEYVTNQAIAHYVLQAGAVISNDVGRGTDADDGAASRRLAISGAPRPACAAFLY